MTHISHGTPVSEDADLVRSLRLQGLQLKDIAAQTGLPLSRIKRVSRTLQLQTVPFEQPAPEATSKEKKKPIRISRVDEVYADLEPGVVHRFILTSAQDDTPVFLPFWNNLNAYARFLGAEIGIGGYTYQLGLYEDHAVATATYAADIAEDLNFDRAHLTPNLLWIGDANVLPTTANPLQGWTTANRGQHVIVPHARVALESIPRMQGQPPRYAISTGTVTEPSYTPRASGRKALFHHTYGALLVEIDTDGECFFRHLLADKDGSFQDLDALVADGRVQSGQRVDAITWGDIHHEQLNPTIAMSSWGYDTVTKRCVTDDNIIDLLKPRYQFLHDTLDFRRRNHHGIKDPHQRAMVRSAGSEDVEAEVAEATGFLNATRRPWCKSIMVESNHDAALARWLKDPEGAADPHNALYWHSLNAAWHGAIRRNEDDFNVVREAMVQAGLSGDVDFVSSGSSYIVDGVECGLHGDLGIGGSRGSPNQYRRLGPKTSSGHTHSPKIVEGVYVAGVSAELEQGYNKGPTSWAHAHIIQYSNGKRILLLMSADGRTGPVGDMEVEHRLAA